MMQNSRQGGLGLPKRERGLSCRKQGLRREAFTERGWIHARNARFSRQIEPKSPESRALREIRATRLNPLSTLRASLMRNREAAQEPPGI